MSEGIKAIDVLELLDEAITTVRDTNYHEVLYGEEGCDGRDVGVLYSDVESAIQETAEQIQQSHDRLTKENKRLREALKSVTTRSHIDFVRCGIGSNYSGENYENKLSEMWKPYIDTQKLLSELGGEL